jgi:hypothetical protein
MSPIEHVTGASADAAIVRSDSDLSNIEEAQGDQVVPKSDDKPRGASAVG